MDSFDTEEQDLYSVSLYSLNVSQSLSQPSWIRRCWYRMFLERSRWTKRSDNTTEFIALVWGLHMCGTECEAAVGVYVLVLGVETRSVRLYFSFIDVVLSSGTSSRALKRLPLLFFICFSLSWSTHQQSYDHFNLLHVCVCYHVSVYLWDWVTVRMFRPLCVTGERRTRRLILKLAFIASWHHVWKDKEERAERFTWTNLSSCPFLWWDGSSAYDRRPIWPHRCQVALSRLCWRLLVGTRDGSTKSVNKTQCC